MENVSVVGLEHKCMATCYLRATESVMIGEQDFRFCPRHYEALKPAIDVYNDERNQQLHPVGA